MYTIAGAPRELTGEPGMIQLTGLITCNVKLAANADFCAVSGQCLDTT